MFACIYVGQALSELNKSIVVRVPVVCLHAMDYDVLIHLLLSWYCLACVFICSMLGFGVWVRLASDGSMVCWLAFCFLIVICVCILVSDISGIGM